MSLIVRTISFEKHVRVMEISKAHLYLSVYDMIWYDMNTLHTLVINVNS